jgi:putative oxidoreductase
MNAITGFFCWGWRTFNKVLDLLTPLGDLFIRFWIAKVFFFAALTKINSWSSTLFLFQHEYHVPLLSAKMAAILGTGAELVLPVLILLGLFGRLPAFMLFVFNIVAVISYPFLLTEGGRIGLNDHFYWGILLMVIMFHGYGKLSLDALFQRLRHKRS